MAIPDLEEGKRREELERADRAKALLDNPMLKTAFDDVEKEILAGMEQTHDEVLVRKLHVMFVLNRKLQNILKSHVETGRMASLQLQEKQSLFKRWS